MKYAKLTLKGLIYSLVFILVPVLSASAAVINAAPAQIPMISNQEEVFLLSGLTNNTAPFVNDVWTSSGALSAWSQISAHTTAPTKWSPRAYVASAYFNNKIWVINGNNNPNAANPLNDVWSSPDGVNWTRVVAQAPWAGGEGSTLTVFNGKMFFIAGGATPLANGVWSTTDGATWTQVATPASSNCLIRWFHQTTVFNNKLWVMGNRTNTASTGYDICSSSDGVHWTPAVAYAPWGTKTLSSTVAFNNKLWVMGGFTTPYTFSPNVLSNDVWSSSDGITWTQVMVHAPWEARQGAAGFVYNGKMWIAGGHGVTSTLLNDVWSSSDGITWTQATGSAAWAARAYHAVIVAQTGVPLQAKVIKQVMQISAK